METVKGRVTLTKAQAASAFGQRLVHQIMAMSHDGEISIEEVRALHELMRTAPADLNAAAFLRQATTSILADGQLDELEQYQLRKAMERVVPKNVRMQLTELLSNIGLPSTFEEDAPDWRSGEARWRSDPMTAKQAHLIRELGAAVDERMTKGEASELIDALLERRAPTPRQRMVLRFFDRCDLECKTKEEVSAWMDALYIKDEAYERAWHLYKLDVGDDGTNRDPLSVPIGEYRKYMRRRASPPAAAQVEFRIYNEPEPRKMPWRSFFLSIGLVLLVALVLVLASAM